MSLKIEFVQRAEAGEPIAKLCRQFGVSRTTGHKWVNRFRELGYDGLEEESRRPKTAPLATAEDLVLAVIELRDKHPRWGPRKLEVVLKRRFGSETPSERTIARILKRSARVRRRRKRRPPSIVERAPSAQAEAPNDVWPVDFKGWWRTTDGQRCDPLTVRDSFSRFVLAVTACRPTGEAVREILERLFRRYGVPKSIQCDNGPPFISVRAPAGLSKLSVWWVSLGIDIVRSRPACPQDNGGHERMHADVRADVQGNPAQDIASQQRVLDRWRQEFNHVRPHQALDGKTPAEVYRVEQRRKLALVRYVYPFEFDVKRVYPGGELRINGVVQHFSEALGGNEVALEHIDAFHARVWFHSIDLGMIEVVPKVPDSVFSAGREHPETKTRQPKKPRRTCQPAPSNV